MTYKIVCEESRIENLTQKLNEAEAEGYEMLNVFSGPAGLITTGYACVILHKKNK